MILHEWFFGGFIFSGVFFFFILGFNSGPGACEAGALPLEPCLQAFLL
jgi:hypothetical protein